MKTLIIPVCILTLTIVAQLGCKSDSSQIIKAAKNDTTEIIRLLLDSSYYRRNSGDNERFFRNNPFGDSLIFKSDRISVGHIPEGYKIKLLNENEICSLATHLSNDTFRFANFLSLKYLEKTDTSYNAAIEDACINPLYDKTGKQLFGFGMAKQNPNLKCMSGNLCGGGINMSFVKQSDTIKAKFERYWIN